jgi:hypothetical protein
MATSTPSPPTTTDASSDDPTDTSDSDSSENPDDITSLFSAYGTNILGDADGRSLNGYTDEIAAHNVSRLRLHSPTAMPATAVLLTLTTVTDPSTGQGFLVAADTAGATYVPVVCVYQGCYPKILLVGDVDSGPTTLQGLPALTGQGVTQCAPLLFDADGDSNGY